MDQKLDWLESLKTSLIDAGEDILPIVLVIFFFQTVVLKRRLPHFRRIAFGFVLVIVGLAVFLVGLEECIFPVGAQMADQLTGKSFLSAGNGGALVLSNGSVNPWAYVWVYAFAFSMGFATTLAEPALIAVALKARDISSGAISAWGLRVAVALGVAVGVTLGVYRIVTGIPLPLFISAGYVVLLAQTKFAPKLIVPLAYDSGGVTTSTVTVPIMVALGVGLASNIEGRSPLLDGFGLIAFASLFPMITVLGYAMIAQKLEKKSQKEELSGGNELPCASKS